jgi:hypothetical protein
MPKSSRADALNIREEESRLIPGRVAILHALAIFGWTNPRIPHYNLTRRNVYQINRNLATLVRVVLARLVVNGLPWKTHGQPHDCCCYTSAVAESEVTPMCGGGGDGGSGRLSRKETRGNEADVCTAQPKRVINTLSRQERKKISCFFRYLVELYYPSFSNLSLKFLSLHCALIY